MPYTVTKSNSGKYIVKKKDSGKVVATTDSAKNLRGIMWHRTHGAGGGQEIGGTFTEGKGAGSGKCQDSDPGCPHCHGHCSNKATTTVYRSDMHDKTGTKLCDKCASDADSSGVFRMGKGGGGGKPDKSTYWKVIGKDGDDRYILGYTSDKNAWLRNSNGWKKENLDFVEMHKKGKGAGGSDMQNMTYPKIGNDTRGYYYTDYQRKLLGNSMGKGGDDSAGKILKMMNFQYGPVEKHLLDHVSEEQKKIYRNLSNTKKIALLDKWHAKFLDRD